MESSQTPPSVQANCQRGNWLKHEGVWHSIGALTLRSCVYHSVCQGTPTRCLCLGAAFTCVLLAVLPILQAW